MQYLSIATIALLSGLTLLDSCAAQAEPVEVTDLTGRKVELEKPAERMVVFPIPTASMLFSVDGSSDRVVGMHPAAKLALEREILIEFFPQAKDIAGDILAGGGNAGFMPNIEAILALNPDLVVQFGGQKGDILGPFDSAGLTTILTLAGDEQKARDSIIMLGAAIGKPEKAAELVGWRDDTIATIQTALANLPQEGRPKVLHLRHAISELRVTGIGTFNDFYIKLAGGINAAAEIEDFKPVSPEQIAVWNPDVILLDGFEAELDLNRIYQDPILSLTNAAQTKRVYKWPTGGFYWSPPNHEAPLGWLWLAALLHPQLINVDLRHEIETWYPKLYGKKPTPEQIDAILRLEMNGDSQHYQQFSR